MKVVIISDSHGDIKVLERIYQINTNADIFIHLGDYEVPEHYLSHYIFVRGNCDFLSNAPLKRDLEFSFGVIHFEHGHNINFSNFENYIKSNSPLIFLFGHTHKKFAQKYHNTYIFNPGSLTRPRDSNIGSYLIIEINQQTKEIEYEFKELN